MNRDAIVNCEFFVLFKLGIVPYCSPRWLCHGLFWQWLGDTMEYPKTTSVIEAFSGPLAPQRMTMLPLDAATSYACGWTKRWSNGMIHGMAWLRRCPEISWFTMVFTMVFTNVYHHYMGVLEKNPLLPSCKTFGKGSFGEPSFWTTPIYHYSLSENLWNWQNGHRKRWKAPQKL